MSDIDWNDESAVINAFVDAVYTGDAETEMRAGERLTAGYVCDGWHLSGGVVEDGMFLRREQVPDLDDAFSALEAWSIGGWGAVLEGTDPTPQECVIACRVYAVFRLEHPEGSGWAIYSVADSRGRDALIAVVLDGGGFDLAVEFVCGAQDMAGAHAGLQTRGFTGIEDFEARWKPPTFNSELHGFSDERSDE